MSPTQERQFVHPPWRGKPPAPSAGDEPRTLRWAKWALESIVLALACLAPWAFGSVEAWAELLLYLGIAAVALLGVGISWASDHRRFCTASWALAGLAVLALAQAVPLAPRTLRVVSPSTSRLRAELLPRTSERVLGDPKPPVALPRPTMSLDPAASLDMAARLAAAWVLFQSVLGLGGGYAAFRRFSLAIVLNAAALALFSLVQALTWNGKIYWFRPSPQTFAWNGGGPFVYHASLATYLNMGLGLALGFLLAAGASGKSRGRGANLWAAYAAGVIGLGVLTSQSRGALVAMAVAAAITMTILRPRTLRLGAGLAVVGGLILVFLIGVGLSSPLERAGTVLTSSAYGIRLLLWEVAARAWPAHPLWGSGLGTFQAAAAPFFRVHTDYIFARAHNDYLDLLVEGGVVGLGLGLVAIISIARLGWRAMKAAPSSGSRALVLGALFSGLTLVIHSLSDFSLHIPGVAVTAVVLCAYLCALGLGAGPAHPLKGSVVFRRLRTVLTSGAIGALSLVVLYHGAYRAKAETQLAHSGVPLPGSAVLTREDPKTRTPILERKRTALERYLRYQPNSAEEHLRLGMVLLALYEQHAAALLREDGVDAAEVRELATPLELHRAIHSLSAKDAAEIGSLLEFEPIRQYLVPAARSFLEARRCCPVLAIAQARLASLDFLLNGGDPAAVYAERAFRLAGPDRSVLNLAARVAVQVQDLDLGARCWRRFLELGGDRDYVADAIEDVFSPDQILNQVLPPDAATTLWFAKELYSDPHDRPTRDRFLRAALQRLPHNSAVPAAERVWLEGQIRANLRQRTKARQLMEAAVAREPLRADWRQDLAKWLLRWGDPAEATEQAEIGLQISPADPGLRHTLEVAAEARARGPAAASRRLERPGTPSQASSEEHR